MHLSFLSKVQNVWASRPAMAATPISASVLVFPSMHKINPLSARWSSYPKLTSPAAAPALVQPETDVNGMPQFLSKLKFSQDGLVAVIVQHIDTGEVLMQAFADRAALNETLQTRLATFYSRSRKGRWCKGETSGAFIHVHKVFVDCDRDSIIYLSDPIGPSCHTGARTCWFSETSLSVDGVQEAGDHTHHADHAPQTTLLSLEQTIAKRREAMQQPSEGKPSWTARLLGNPELACKKVREEAGELCQTLEKSEGRERAASEMADLLYHAMVLLNLQGVSMEEVLRELRRREGVSGVVEKASRQAKPQ
ncbi:bifunctional phosphoribosyl-AMP cyclohydrolase/phosphoribosyl-ATP pyrophosphatase [Dunaliella salina]|uniref:Bifunctional phosphoribosyl-AMP cyclohydrolase/phosphoribosyl-ATP pyrophosphatase n=1 Tax=Dunaliella salina TaxID=3046 RepID=A0ABQ7GQD6_DUNSA|nr:bifunctional phosphoribosyl-AMP cyclohydrolase/phosphoribosyl-ATP pyrophosphatase [Dunaliella salina]|eukprot:KAF5836817.1 bifunctional phosphoribosyl-AMP cyclohydrolase/phosphoribosyl-ATP pyrophosphatase [Dunaliella salina]